MITGLYVGEKGYGKITLDGGLKDYYRLLECDTIEAPEFQIDDEIVTVICDEEGLFKENPMVRIWNSKNEPLIVGNIFLCKANYETGEFTSLENKTIEKIIKNNLKMVITERGLQYVLVIK